VIEEKGKFYQMEADVLPLNYARASLAEIFNALALTF